jgi:outer membrane protein OmpA-like peptidoglycan-associated protein
MKKLFQVTALTTAVLLGACASAPGDPPPELVQARDAVRSAEVDPQVLASAPLELKRATESLNRANLLFNKKESLAEVASAATVAERQAQTAMEIARAKRAEEGIRAADTDRERVRADIQAAQAARAQNQAQMARAQASVAGARAASAEARANSAEVQAATAQASAADAQQQAALAQQQALALQQQLTQIKAQQTDRGMLVTLGDVLFEFGRADVKPGAGADIGKLAEFLRQHPDRRIRIEGYTDSVGGADYNKALSQRRADAVRAALVAQGVPADRIDTAGYGKEYPVADNSSDTNRALNRRVEVYISNNDQPVRPRRG